MWGKVRNIVFIFYYFFCGNEEEILSGRWRRFFSIMCYVGVVSRLVLFVL